MPTSPTLLIIAKAGVNAYPLPRHGHVTIGRGQSVTIRIEDPSISREHARIDVRDGFFIRDLGSSNGTFIRGIRLDAGERALDLCQIVVIGDALAVIKPTRTLTPLPR